jgi:hypothetical protein
MTAQRFGIQREIRSFQCAVAIDVGAQHVLQAGRQVALDHVPKRLLRALRPAAGLDARRAASVEPHVEREADLVGAEARHPGRYLRGLFDGRAADHDAIDAMAQQVVDDRQCAQAATDLQVHRLLAGEPNDDVAVREPTVARAVEVDDVQPGRSQRAVTRQQLMRFVVVLRLRGEIAAQQPDAAPTAQVDRGNQAHQGSPGRSDRKLASRRAPATLERSGWNCVPQKLSRRTTAATSTP